MLVCLTHADQSFLDKNQSFQTKESVQKRFTEAISMLNREGQETDPHFKKIPTEDVFLINVAQR